MIRYVNCRKEHCTHYCGRRESYGAALGLPVDLSILGNPHPLSKFKNRDACIREYAKTLAAACKQSPKLIDILKSIPDDAVLGCFCYPKSCHCQVIIDAVNFYKTN
jgi:hypothetical protein